MKMIVDIPDNIFKQFIDDWTGTPYILHAVRHSIPLVEPNMRLINANELIDKLANSELYNDDYYYSIVYDAIKRSLVFVETDATLREE